MIIAPASRHFYQAVAAALVVLSCISGLDAAAQSYTNPNYRGSSPKKGEAVQTPSYSSPSDYANSAQGSGSSGAEGGTEVAISAGIPVGVGVAGQGLVPKFGVHTQLYIDSILGEEFRNFLAVGYDSFRLKADANATLHLIPFTFGLEFAPVKGRTFNPTFGVALGGLYAMIAVPESVMFNGRAYFLAQLRPGLDIDFDGFTVVFNSPINFVIGQSSMTYMAYTLGARFGL
jgi:hypothetical protein